MDRYSEVFENNKKWIESKLEKDKDFFKKLAKEQNPDFLFIGCSDSRVPANDIMGVEPGDVFVHRNIANLVINTDANVQAVIQYAVEHLKVKYVVVCGHYGCGGVKAAMLQEDLGQLNGWLRHIRDVYRLRKDELNEITDEYARYNRLVELNVEEQVTNVLKTAFVQKSYGNTGFPTVHGWVYGVADGVLKDLNIDFKKKLQEIQEIYKIV
ncbi:carbonic anhydrase [Algivirga pacifica]|uniref:Carbonic anhydrase n=1 Tax=Algivirga pacifica TaxID=1162670 RepID=A0ABP9DEF7_9BACT